MKTEFILYIVLLYLISQCALANNNNREKQLHRLRDYLLQLEKYDKEKEENKRVMTSRVVNFTIPYLIRKLKKKKENAFKEKAR